MRARDHAELAGLWRRGIELDADVEHGALHRVATHAAVAMPRKIREPSFRAGHLDDDAVAIESVGRGPQFGTTQGTDAPEATVVVERGDGGAVVVEVVDAVAHVDPFDRRPPRAPVVWRRCLDRGVDLLRELLDLLRREDAPKVEVARPSEVVAHLVVVIVERERALGIERLSAPREHRKRIGELVDLLTVERGAQTPAPNERGGRNCPRDLHRSA